MQLGRIKMMAVTIKADKQKALSELLRKEIGSRVNAAYISRMQAFAAEHSVPEQIRDLLNDLDEAEARANRSKSGKPN